VHSPNRALLDRQRPAEPAPGRGSVRRAGADLGIGDASRARVEVCRSAPTERSPLEQVRAMTPPLGALPKSVRGFPLSSGPSLPVFRETDHFVGAAHGSCEPRENQHRRADFGPSGPDWPLGALVKPIHVLRQRR